jgi:hypothetical protein
MHHEKGAALISVLMVVVVFLLLGTALLQWTAVEAIQVQRQERQLQAHYLARSGLDVALNYVFEQVAQGISVKDMKLSDLKYPVGGVGSYEVTFTKGSEKQESVEIRVRGYLTGPVPVEETIKAYLELTTAEEIGWGEKRGKHLDLRFPDKEYDGLVLFVADNQVVTINDNSYGDKDRGYNHYFKAPAMVFSSATLSIKNGSTLHLYTDFVAFGTEIKLLGKDNLLTLNVNTNPIIEDGVKYGVVYFARTLSGVDRPGYYKFRDGTTWENGTLRTPGYLIPTSSTELLTFFSSRIVYSSGN